MLFLAKKNYISHQLVLPTRYFIYFVGAICDIAFDRFLITLPSPYQCMPLRLKTPISRGSLQENQGELLIENFFSIFTHLYIFVAFWNFIYRCLFIYNITYLSNNLEKKYKRRENLASDRTRKFHSLQSHYSNIIR